MDSIVDNYMVIDPELAQDLEEIEQACSPAPPSGLPTIYRLKREVLEFKRAASPLSRPAHAHDGSRSPVPQEMRLRFRDVADHVTQVVEHVDSYDRLLTDVLNAHLAQSERPDHRAAEQRHAQDLGVGRDRGGPDHDREPLRHELRAHAGALPVWGYPS